MVGMWAFTAMDLGLIPGWGANIPQATWYGKKKKNPKTKINATDVCIDFVPCNFTEFVYLF